MKEIFVALVTLVSRTAREMGVVCARAECPFSLVLQSWCPGIHDGQPTRERTRGI